MTQQETVRTLLAAARMPADRKAARGAWVRETMAALRAAQRKVDAAWDRTLAALPDDLSEEELDALDLPQPPEQAELDALRALIDAVVERDLWPRELYWGCV